MDVSVVGRVSNTGLSPKQALRPVYEAIINSIHAIEDAGCSDGHIDVIVKRDESDTVLAGNGVDMRDEGARRRIVGFWITDNGVGFTEENFSSFNKSDSRHKEDRGGRGVGRFLWLKVFDHVHINSTFEENGTTRHRVFDFKLSERGIDDHHVADASDHFNKGTIVELIGIRDSYLSGIPALASTIALHIVEHCLEYFVLDLMPEVFLTDDDERDPIVLHDVYHQLVKQSITSKFSIKKKPFTITHFLLTSRSGFKHSLHYCADKRVVLTKPLASRIPNLVDPLPSLNGINDTVSYAGYLASAYLDSHVNQERTGFHIYEETDALFNQQPSISEIDDEALKSTAEYLAPYIEPVRQQKMTQIGEYVERVAPQYRPLLRYRPDAIERIPAGLNEDKLDQHLYELSKQLETEAHKQAHQLLEEQQHATADEDIVAKYQRFLEEWNDVGKANLAKYVVHRKITLEILARELERHTTGSYSLEAAVHKLIFPLKSTSDDLNFEDQNLWIIDEKLAFHRYLASDLSLKQMETIDNNSLSRPDILVFNHPIAIIEDDPPFSSITVIEFKRPRRDDYNSDENPIDQVYQYVQEIRSGKALTSKGRPISIPDHTPFYCYIVADLTASLQRAADYRQLIATPDGQGYFGYNPKIGAYIELLSFQKLVTDAKRRNAALFQKLALPQR